MLNPECEKKTSEIKMRFHRKPRQRAKRD